jgi:hypothetical protein
MTAQVPSPSPAPQRASNRATVNGNRPPGGAIICNGCRNWWTGLGAAHCSSCHQTFTGVSAFELHRSGSHAGGTRHCLDRQRSARRRTANPCSSPPTNHGRAGPGPAPGEDPTNDRQRGDARLLAGTWGVLRRSRTQRHRSHPPGQATDCRRGVRRQCDLRREHHLADGRQEDRQVPHRLQRRPVPPKSQLEASGIIDRQVQERGI